MTILVTGGAGFIGARVVGGLNVPIRQVAKKSRTNSFYWAGIDLIRIN